ncbi:hypothetical protein CGI36_11950 [Vibrio parahaemolyticus]|nr:hypothetical protein CGJ50_11850 [Vibrio parahaemolyticus]TOI07690.1 hypothetical protein CGI69_02725 [Vibrio parahaemolyticus]TOJ37093.1 hypothetical protein CGI40_15325 [Vibrio parahaemolyticus]TOJ68008.1 hypothetical protein CGI36_11950 [Vibrio parahaemolyticus]
MRTLRNDCHLLVNGDDQFQDKHHLKLSRKLEKVSLVYRRITMITIKPFDNVGNINLVIFKVFY